MWLYFQASMEALLVAQSAIRAAVEGNDNVVIVDTPVSAAASVM